MPRGQGEGVPVESDDLKLFSWVGTEKVGDGHTKGVVHGENDDRGSSGRVRERKEGTGRGIRRRGKRTRDSKAMIHYKKNAESLRTYEDIPLHSHHPHTDPISSLVGYWSNMWRCQ